MVIESHLMVMSLTRWHSYCAWLACMILISCSEMIPDGKDVVEFRKELLSFRDSHVTVDSMTETDGVFTFSFSNGAEIGIESVFAPIVTIDVRGGWLKNGVQTGETAEEIVARFSSMDNERGDILGVVEEYEGWSFHFGKKRAVYLKKSLFSFDPDTFVRGVNHRGFCMKAPENTLPAYRLSKLSGFRYVETDVQFTADNVPVLIHDATVDRTSDGNGAVKEMSWDEISRLDFGSWMSDEFSETRISSLSEFLALCREIGLFPYIELKAGTKAQIESVVDLVGKYGMEGKVVYISFSSVHLQYVIDKNPKATVGYLTGNPLTEGNITIAIGMRTGSNTVFIDSPDFSEEAVSLCRNASIPMEVWTINSEDVILSLSDYISGVTSNNLHAGRVLAQKGN